MATVRGGSQTSRSGYHSRSDINKTMKPAIPRDDLNEAFAGDENEALNSDKSHSTQVKSRKTEKSKTRIPKR